MAEIRYSREADLSVEEFIEVLKLSTLGERRPIDDPDRIRTMLKNASLIITARIKGKLVGVARSITDWTYCTYLSDLAVDQAMQKKGIGKELIRQTKLAAPTALLILLSAPAAVKYYPHIGMTQHPSAHILDDIKDLE